MKKEQQIKEMAKIIDELYNVYDTTAEDIAEGLYNIDYRKTFTSDTASDTQKAFKEGYEKDEEYEPKESDCINGIINFFEQKRIKEERKI